MFTRNDILCLEFDSVGEMRNLLESSATKYEGFIENRVGYNFPLVVVCILHCLVYNKLINMLLVI